MSFKIEINRNYLQILIFELLDFDARNKMNELSSESLFTSVSSLIETLIEETEAVVT